MSTGAARGPEELATEPPETDELRAHLNEVIGRLVGDRRAVEVGDEPPPADAEAIVLTEDVADPERLRARLARAGDAAAGGTPTVVSVATGPAGGAGISPDELRRAFEGVPGVRFLEQRPVEATVANLPTGPAGEAAAGGGGPATRLVAVANLPAPDQAEVRLSGTADGARETVEGLERRLSELRAENLELARSRLGERPDPAPAVRARAAERRLLFARVRETLSALLSRRRLRG